MDGVEAFAAGRMVARAVCRLEWSPVHGLDPGDWASSGVSPEDLALPLEEVPARVVRADQGARLTLARARTVWPATAWSGLFLDYDVLPGAGFPEIYGSCHWSVWWCGAWRVRCALEYPTSAPARDPRWPAWVQDFERCARAELVR